MNTTYIRCSDCVVMTIFRPGRVSDLNVQLKTAKSQADSARQNLIDYKEKAVRILLVRDW